MLDKNLAYYAGFFDGEGCVAICTHGRKRYFGLQVSISQAGEPNSVLRDLKSNFGGTIYHHAPKTDKQRQAWRWQVSSNAAVSFLKAIEPYVVLKLKQLKLGIQFQERVNLSPYRKGSPGNSFDEQEIELRYQMYLLMRGLKKVA